MKKNIIKLFSLAVLALAGWSCETQYYNEEYLDGYSPDTEITDVQQIELTLTEADYATIAKNSTNKATAEAAGAEAVSALEAIGKNKYFANEDEVKMYLPAFIAANYPTLDNSSVAFVTYKTALDVPAEIQAMNAAKSYTLKEEDYAKIWEGAENGVQAVTPATINKLAGVLSSEGMEAGDYLAVTYNYSAEEPKAEEEETPEEPAEKEYTSVLGSAKKDDAVTVKGYISAVSAQGPIVTDNGGSLLFYDKNNGVYKDLKVGDEVTAVGTITSFNFGFQLDASKGATLEVTGTTEVKYPVPTELTGADMDALLTSRTADEYCYFVKVSGTAAVSGNYINFNVPGANTAVGSIYGATDAVKAELTDGRECTVYGYFTSISKSSGNPKFVNLIVVSVDAAPAIDLGNDYTSVIGSAKKDDAVTIKGYISAVSAQGPIVTDNGGSLLFYDKNNGVYKDLKVGDEVTAVGTITSFNFGFQLDASKGATLEVTGTTEVKYPVPTELTGADMDALLTSRTADEYCYFVKVSGTAAVSGNYINFNVPGANTAVGSIYGATDAVKAELTDGRECTVYGYFTSISKSSGNPKFVNLVVTKVESTSTTAAAATATVQSEKKYAFYQWNGTAFQATDIVAVQPSDYTAMGQGYGYFTDPAQDKYLPKFLNATKPYAMAKDQAYVAYRCYAGDSTSWRVDHYTFDGAAWVKTIYFANNTAQFRKEEGEWKPDRTLELVYTTMGTPEFKAFCQYCCNWVYDNIDVPLGAPARDNAGVIISADKVTVNGESPAGSWYVSSYGNNEWYAGTYAYYGEMNWSASKARPTYEALGFTGLSDEEIIAKMQQNAAEVFANVLSYMYPEVTYEIHNQIVVKVYDYVSKTNYAYTFATIGKGQFEYVEGSFTAI